MCLGSLLIANVRSRSCLGGDELQSRVDRFRRRYWKELKLYTNPVPPQDERTCTRVAAEVNHELSHRALSPWSHYLDRDPSRIPHEISFAKCLCEGCIIRQQEDHTYNSVPVFAEMLVLKMTPCEHDQNTYVVKTQAIKIPVACTCVLPKYTT